MKRRPKEIAQLALEGTGGAPVQLAIGEISENALNMRAGAVAHLPSDWEERSRLVDQNRYNEGLYAPARHAIRAAMLTSVLPKSTRPHIALILASAAQYTPIVSLESTSFSNGCLTFSAAGYIMADTEQRFGGTP